jgi:repressor LexA
MEATVADVTDEVVEAGRGDTVPHGAGAPDADLTPRQRDILHYLHEFQARHGYPPSVREVGDAVGLASPSSVHAQLATLERKGFLKRDPAKPRALELSRDLDSGLDLAPEAARHVPLVGEIAAGAPIVAEERVDAVYPLPKDLVGDGTLFMLKVRGDSMIEAGVFDGDFVVVREQPTVEQGEMCAALVEGEATVKFFRRTKAGEIFLDPANAAYDPIPVTPDQDARIMGKVTAVLRSVR